MATFTLGRDFEQPLKIDEKHASVSHNHATIEIEGDRWTLIDNDSTNGTYVEEAGGFRRCKRMSINPGTWIRLGEQGHRGYYFKARRVLKPNDFREDFEEVYQLYQEFEEAKAKLDSQRRFVKFIAPALSLLCFGLSYCIPGINNNPNLTRLFILVPGLITPLISDQLLSKPERRIKEMQKRLICPKCRRVLGKDDILNREHLICHAR